MATSREAVLVSLQLARSSRWVAPALLLPTTQSTPIASLAVHPYCREEREAASHPVLARPIYHCRHQADMGSVSRLVAWVTTHPEEAMDDGGMDGLIRMDPFSQHPKGIPMAQREVSPHLAAHPGEQNPRVRWVRTNAYQRAEMLRSRARQQWRPRGAGHVWTSLTPATIHIHAQTTSTWT